MAPRYMGVFNAVQVTIRWRAQVRGSKIIKIRQLSMIVSTLRDWYKSVFIIWLFNIFPSMSSHNVNQIFFYFSRPQLRALGALRMEMSVARFKPLWSGWMSGAAWPSLAGLSDARCCSNYFQVSNLTTCQRNNNQKSEISARNHVFEPAEQ